MMDLWRAKWLFIVVMVIFGVSACGEDETASSNEGDSNQSWVNQDGDGEGNGDNQTDDNQDDGDNDDDDGGDNQDGEDNQDTGDSDLCEEVTCDAGTYCEPYAGSCVACVESAHCGAGEICTPAFQCVDESSGGGGQGACQSDQDCGQDQTCLVELGMCLPGGGMGTGCAVDADCGAGETCMAELGMCMPDMGFGDGCEDDGDCGPGETCLMGMMCLPDMGGGGGGMCFTDDMCDPSQSCDLATLSCVDGDGSDDGTCQENSDCTGAIMVCDLDLEICVADGDSCDQVSDCDAEEVCHEEYAVCVGCNDDNDCDTGQYCDGEYFRCMDP